MQNCGLTLEARNLTRRFTGITAVDEISFTIRSGEVLGYLGPNGSGKSTTVRMLIGLLDPSGGSILLNGKSIFDDLPAYQQRIGYVPEESNLYPYLSGFEFLQLSGRLRGLSRRVLEPRIEELLQLFSLWEDRDTAVSAYSKGMRQKILLSAALIHNPDILILDEPLSGLDVNTMLVMRELMNALAARGRAIFYCSHVLDIVEKVCSRVLILRHGRVVADDSVGRLREIMQQPSLEGVFSQLTEETDHDRVAQGILEAIGA